MRLWLIPLPYFAVGILAGAVLPRLDEAYFPRLEDVVSVGSAQAYLSALASGMITLTAVVFSILFVMMQMTMTAYSKRLLILFAGNPVGLHVLGVFSATFLSALGTLQFVDRRHDGHVPLLSMEFDTALLMLSMVLLALLVQRIALLRITYVLKFIGDKGRTVIAGLLPRPGHSVTEELIAQREKLAELQSQAPAQRIAYTGVPLAIANIRIDDIVRLAQRSGGTIVLNCAIGDTVAHGTLLLEVFATTPIPERTLLRTIILKTERTFEQDPKYAFRLLVDTAILALSPAVNDPTTAVQAIDQLQDLLNRLGRRVLDAGFVNDARGELRLVFPMPTWEEYLALAFDEIRLYGASTIQVLRRMRAALVDLIDSLDEPERIAAVRRYLDHLTAMVQSSDLDAMDRVLAMQADPQGLGHTRTTK